MKKRIITLVTLIFTISTLLLGCVKENIEVRQFYISKGKKILTQETCYVLTSDDIRCNVTKPELILYCKDHVGEIVSIKVKLTYDSRGGYKDVKFISIEE